MRYCTDKPKACPMCTGPSEVLGQLGYRTHYRCRDCGWIHATKFGHLSDDAHEAAKEAK